MKMVDSSSISRESSIDILTASIRTTVYRWRDLFQLYEANYQAEERAGVDSSRQYAPQRCRYHKWSKNAFGLLYGLVSSS
jgi:hypothetical protein